MVATQTNVTPPYQAGERIRVDRRSVTTPGRNSSNHSTSNRFANVVSIDATGGGMGQAHNTWTTSGQSSFLTLTSTGGENR